MNIAQKYVNELKNAYYTVGKQEKWDDFESVMHGASQEDLDKLREQYPEIPDSLVGLLEIMDGTYFREYAGEKRNLYVLGSDICEYPYYLLSAEEMLEVDTPDWLKDYINSFLYNSKCRE